METFTNETGGVSIRLLPEDSLDEVPQSHRKMVNQNIESIFRNIPEYFETIGKNAPVPAMRKWVRKLLDHESCSLLLQLSGYSKESRASFSWTSNVVRGAEFGPLRSKVKLKSAVGDLFRLIEFLDWMGIGVTGKLFSPQDYYTVGALGIEDGPKVNLSRSIAWGEFNGDVLIQAPGDFGGWRTISGRIVPLGTVTDSVEWVFDQLLNKRAPTLD